MNPAPTPTAKSQHYNGGRRLSLHFVGNRTPRLSAFQFCWNTKVKGQLTRLHTKLPKALADFFVAFAVLRAVDCQGAFSYSDQTNAKTIGIARENNAKNLCDVFVDASGGPCCQSVIVGDGLAREKKTPKKKRAERGRAAKQEKPITLWVNEEVLPADCVEIFWDKYPRDDVPLTDAAQLNELLSAIRGKQARPHAARLPDISRIMRYVPEKLIGREDETALLNLVWAKAGARKPKRPHILTFVALGGEGKTSLVAKWVAELASRSEPGWDAAFAWPFSHQGTDENPADFAGLFLKEALIYFGDDKDKEFAVGPAGPFEKGQRLAGIVGRQRSLLILDGLEPLQHPSSSTTFAPGELKNDGVAKLLKDLAIFSQGLCVVTTRCPLPDLNAFKGNTVQEEPLTRLPRKFGVELLQKLGVHGREHRDIPLKDGDTDSEKVNGLEKLVEDVKGHALTLTIFGGFLKRAFLGDIRQRDRVKFVKADATKDGGHAWRTMAAYEQWLLSDGGDEGRREVAVLRLVGLFDRPADAGCLTALRSETIPGLTEPLAGLADEDWEFCLSRLEDAKLLTVNRDASGALVSLDSHQHIREYFAAEVRKPDFDRPEPHEPSNVETTSYAWRAAHRRLYAHLCTTTAPWPDTLKGLQPLYQAVAHGCKAGLYQEACDNVYLARILRGKEEAYSTHTLGAHGFDLGATACFFDHWWTKVSPRLLAADQAWIQGEAGLSLRELGRLPESLELMRASLENFLKLQDLPTALQGIPPPLAEAARMASNLSQLYLLMGQVVDARGNQRGVALAVSQAKKSMDYADRSKSPRWTVGARTAYADALHHANRRGEAETLFRKAEQRQAERSKTDSKQPAYLCALPNFRHCDLLLANAERGAWLLMLRRGGRPAGTHDSSTPPTTLSAFSVAEAAALTALRKSCRIVVTHAKRAREWDKGLKRVNDVALANLTLARAVLYLSVLDSSNRVQSPNQGEAECQDADSTLDKVVSELNNYGAQRHIPRGYLARAWQRSLTGARTDLQNAQSDLDAAWEIAVSGPMKLFMADIHLYRARLFFRDARYPWKSPQDDLAAAKELINTCGYHRRDEELADAKAAVEEWLPRQTRRKRKV